MGKHLRVEPALRPTALIDAPTQFGYGNQGTPLLLRATAAACFIFPSNMVLEPLGAAGYVAHVLALLVFALWTTSVMFGLHQTIDREHPGRAVLAALFVVSCASYAAMYVGISGGSTDATRASADRWMLLMVASSGIVLMTTETTRTVDAAMQLVRALLFGAVFCSLVAAYQFVAHADPMAWFQGLMPGFKDNGGNQPFQERGSFLRVAGSTFHPIELGVIASMLLPLALWRALYDHTGRKWMHWAGTGLIVFAIAATISRSAVLGVLTVAFVFLPFLPSRSRQWTVLGFLGAAVLLFLAVPGFVATLFGTVTAGTADTSITARLEDYPRVEAMMSARPWLGIGPGAYLTRNAIEVLDNQYLKTIVEMGVPGFLALLAYMVVPGIAAWTAAFKAKAERLKTLAGAVAASCLVAAPASAAFDFLGFPVVALIYPFCVGLSGTVWLLVADERRTSRPTTNRQGAHPAESERQP
ncbi:O-antigen ligase [Pseudarthrobacter equi]|uniref:O-antigen ligase n=1 Tax=Pseudarthrobacter equi TaxID=728066 RepID=A0A1H1SXE7_9MICC|nr:O-antigen ligase family protein [Pseudarthrobacter equi]SDS52650.1 O-antigen ligase [Pseudarthrobacter equi]